MENYSSFTMSITTLFAAALTVYEDDFTTMEPLGSILLSIYVIVSAIMLVNLLIALLAEAFSDLLL